MGIHILVVDDEAPIAELVAVYLQNEGYSVYTCGTGQEALDYVNQARVDLAVLDVMLPDLDGFSVCRKLRETHFFPIIMLTAKVEDMDKIMGLTIGADDYITKPFNPLELVARVKTQLRRTMRYDQAADSPGNELDIRGLIINKDSHKCTLYGKPLSLTPMEFGILWHLCENQGKAVSSEALFEAVWGEKFLDNNNTVMAHIGRLREKLGDSSRNPKFIRTIWGIVYMVE